MESWRLGAGASWVLSLLLVSPAAKAVSPRQDLVRRVVEEFRDAASFRTVVDAFLSGDSDLTPIAALALGRLEDERALSILREKLSDPAYPRAEIARAVGVRGHVQAVEPLLALAAEPAFWKNEYHRSPLVLSLCRIGTPRRADGAVAQGPGRFGSRQEHQVDGRAVGSRGTFTRHEG